MSHFHRILVSTPAGVTPEVCPSAGVTPARNLPAGCGGHPRRGTRLLLVLSRGFYSWPLLRRVHFWWPLVAALEFIIFYERNAITRTITITTTVNRGLPSTPYLRVPTPSTPSLQFVSPLCVCRRFFLLFRCRYDGTSKKCEFTLLLCTFIASIKYLTPTMSSTPLLQHSNAE